MSTFHCRNCDCGNPPQAQFCNQCGQQLHVPRIDAHYLWHELPHGLLHVDKDIFFTIKELARRPGRMVREFIAGSWARHFKPVGFLLVMAGAYALLRHYLPEASDHDRNGPRLRRV